MNKIMLSLKSEFLKEIDQAWKKHHFDNRSQFIREAVRDYFREHGHTNLIKNT